MEGVSKDELCKLCGDTLSHLKGILGRRYIMDKNISLPENFSRVYLDVLDNVSMEHLDIVSICTRAEHLEWCCGSEGFLAELFGEMGRDREYDTQFLLLIALVLPEDMSSTLGDRLWNCIPLIIKAEEKKLYDPLCLSSIFPTYSPTITELLDLAICTNELPFFGSLMGSSDNYLQIPLRQLQEGVNAGLYLPRSVERVFNMAVALLPYEKQVSDYFYERMGLYLEIHMNFYCDGIRIEDDMPHNIYALFLEEDEDMAPNGWECIDVNFLQKYVDILQPAPKREIVWEDLLDNVQLPEMTKLLDSLCVYQVPLYINNEQLNLRKTFPAKSSMK